MIWVSLDLDWVTGDCRQGVFNGCAQQCCVEGRAIKRGSGDPIPLKEALQAMEKFRKWILSLDVQAVVVRDSHVTILNYLQEGDYVLHYDYHADLDCDFSPMDSPHCGSWVDHAMRRGVTVNRCNGLDFEHVDEPVNFFVAVSRPFTNTKFDGALFRLLIDLMVPVDLFGGKENTP